MQTQLAQLHEKYGIEVLKSEQLETMNKENQKITDGLKSEIVTLKEKNEQLEENYQVRLNENKKLNNTIIELKKSSNLARTESLPNLTASANREPMQSREIRFNIQCPPSSGETSVYSKNYELLQNISGFFELILRWERGRVGNPMICIKPKVTSMVSCDLSVAVGVLSNSKKTSKNVYKSNMYVFYHFLHS